MDEQYFGKDEPWVKHKSSTKEYRLSKDEAISALEDLCESSFNIGGDVTESDEEAFEVRGQFTPRPVLGVMVIRRAHGKLYTRVEE